MKALIKDFTIVTLCVCAIFASVSCVTPDAHRCATPTPRSAEGADPYSRAIYLRDAPSMPSSRSMLLYHAPPGGQRKQFNFNILK